METLKITVDDEQTKQLVVRLLHQIKGVTINQKKAPSSRNTAAALKELSGIWAGRDVDPRRTHRRNCPGNKSDLLTLNVRDFRFITGLSLR